MGNTRKQRATRTTNEQLETYLAFLENNAQFLAGKNTPENTKFLEEKWTELAIKLNTLKRPQKIGKEWKISVTHWKNQLKSRAIKIKEELIVTGGGETSTPNMSAFEERALNVFGIIAVHEDCDGCEDCVPVIGLTNSNQTSVAATIEVERLTPEAEIVNTDLPGVSQTNLALVDRETRKQPYKSSFSAAISDCVSKINKLAEDRADHDKKIAEKRLDIDRQNANSMTRMAEAMYVIAQQLKKNP